jgi:pimeloyl-ACP methyl ester carboxylesterase
MPAAVGLMADPKVVRSEAPTAVLWGTADPFFGVEWAHWLGGVIPGCSVERGGEVTELEDAKLFLPEDRPEALVEVLKRLWS